MKIFKISYAIVIGLIAIYLAVSVFRSEWNYMQTPAAAAELEENFRDKVYERRGEEAFSSHEDGEWFDAGSYNDVAGAMLLRPHMYAFLTLFFISFLGYLPWWLGEVIVRKIKSINPQRSFP